MVGVCVCVCENRQWPLSVWEMLARNQKKKFTLRVGLVVRQEIIFSFSGPERPPATHTAGHPPCHHPTNGC